MAGATMPWLVILPLLGMIAALPLGRRAGWVLAPVGAGCVVLAAALVALVWSGGVQTYRLGGWSPPLGILLRADGLSAAFVLTTAVVTTGAGVYATAGLHGHPKRDSGIGEAFWPALMALWTALNAIFLGNDLFNLYVALELLTLGAVVLVALEGQAGMLAAAMRYLMFALLGSLAYLAGTVLLYGGYGTLDMTLLAAATRRDPTTLAACALMTAGLMAKTALFPLHVWLPPAHAGAPPPASALLSGLVTKAAFYLVVRLWFDVLPDSLGAYGSHLLGAFGAAAILIGSTMAMRQVRLKLLVAYSTVAQLGYLFLMFPLAGLGTQAQPWAAGAFSGGVFHALSHALAKAAMFLAVGAMAAGAGHDRMAGLAGMARHLPMAVFAFGLAGLTLMGLPPSGGFIAKWLLLTSALASGQWWWAAVMLAGGLLAAAYLFRALGHAFGDADHGTAPAFAPVPRRMELVPLLLALLSVLLGLASMPPFLLLGIGRPESAEEGF